MTVKLALLNIRKRWQDYVVLLMGLVISVAIFYMFQTLSTNLLFLQEVIPTLSMVGLIFAFGSVLLGLITIVYIFYANSFLLSMRKKEYGMYLMFGAKKKKIKQMMTIETLAIGGISLTIGSLLGVVFSKIMSQVLMAELRIKTDSYQALSLNAFLITAGFFAFLFILTTFFNRQKFARTTLLNLLHEEQASEKYRPNKFLTIFLTVIAILLNGIGYWALANIQILQLMGLGIALVTILLGTFLFFGALFPTVTNFFKNWNFFSQKKLRMFTLSQLSFKASSISRVFAMITMMLALSLGALTVGLAFNTYKEAVVTAFAYDVVSYNPTPEISAELNKLAAETRNVYHVKVIDETIYYTAEELTQQPFFVAEQQDNDLMQLQTYTTYQKFKAGDVYSLMDQDFNSSIHKTFREINDAYSPESNALTNYHVLSQAEFDQLEAKTNVVDVIKTKNYGNDLDTFAKINDLELSRYPEGRNNSKYSMFTIINSMISGFVFMGAFLGIAFLAMLASCLMFKILSGANQDIPRYQMLHKIGVKRQLISRSINQEIGLVFLVPGLLGMVHVLFGLKMFEILLPNPYANLYIPFGLFGLIYLLYYLITVILYKRIVLKKQ